MESSPGNYIHGYVFMHQCCQNKFLLCLFHLVSEVTQILILAELHFVHTRESFGFVHKSVNVYLPTMEVVSST